MSKKSEAVKTWRRRTKDRIVEAMGGKCLICGYDGCTATFDLHHLDPSTKSFSMGGVRANPRAWAQIVEELRKCVLLCANCHREVEDGYVTLDTSQSTFNENFVDYEWVEGKSTRITNKGMCLQCFTVIIAITKNQKYCSDVCRCIHQNKKYDKIRRYNGPSPKNYKI
jgi:hypothetical protein